MSAEMLREAAALMRKRAEAATDGPWRLAPGSDGQGWGSDTYDVGEAWRPADVEYIAAMHPGVALALADLLEEEAEIVGLLERAGLPTRQEERVFAIARAYLRRGD